MRLGSFFRRVPKGSCRARRRVCGPGRRARLVLLGDPPSLDGDDADPHCCARPFDAVAVPSPAAAAACLATWAGGLLFGADGVAAAAVNPQMRGMPPPPPRSSRSPRQRRLRSRTPKPSRRARRVPRRSREAAALPRWDAECRPAAHPDPPPPPWSASGMAHPCPMPVHLPGELRNALAFRKRHPDVGIPQWMPRPTQDFRLPSGFPVCRSPSGHAAQERLEDGGRIASAPKRHQKRTLSSPAAAGRNADFARCHYLLPQNAEPIGARKRDVLRQARR